MPTAIEYGQVLPGHAQNFVEYEHPWHGQGLVEYAMQNGCASGPPNLMTVQNVALQGRVLPGSTSSDGPLTGLFVVPLVLVSVVVAVRRRLARRSEGAP